MRNSINGCGGYRFQIEATTLPAGPFKIILDIDFAEE
jgi:hypothetical protein